MKRRMKQLSTWWRVMTSCCVLNCTPDFGWSRTQVWIWLYQNKLELMFVHISSKRTKRRYHFVIVPQLHFDSHVILKTNHCFICFFCSLNDLTGEVINTHWVWMDVAAHCKEKHTQCWIWQAGLVSCSRSGKLLTDNRDKKVCCHGVWGISKVIWFKSGPSCLMSLMVSRYWQSFFFSHYGFICLYK